MSVTLQGSTVLRDVVALGGLLTLAAVAIIELLSRTVSARSSLAVLLAVVALVAVVGGLVPGLVSAGITSLYGAHYLSSPGQIFRYRSDDALHLLQLVIAAFAIALTTGMLRRAMRASEEKRRHQRDLLKAINNSVGEGVYALDREGRVTLVNPAAEQMLGWTEAELLGRVMHDIIHFQHADGRPYPREACTSLAVLRTGVMSRNEDDVFTRKDGTILPVTCSSAPIIMDGEIAGVVVAFCDITVRKQQEEALRRSEATAQLIVSRMPAHVWMVDTDLRVTSVLGAGLTSTGIDPSQYLGKTLYELTGRPEQPLSPVIAAHLRALDGEPAEYEIERQHRHYEARVEPLRDADDRIVGCLGLALDTTRRKRNEQRIATQYQVSRTLAEATDPESVVPRILKAIGECLEWQYGALWIVDWRDNVLRCVHTWQAASVKFPEFDRVSRETTFALGVGVPGRIWTSRQPIWLADVADEPNFARGQIASSEGLHACCGLPILIDQHVIGVLEFLSHDVREPDHDAMEMLAAIGSQVGQFVERKRAEKAERQSEGRKAAILDSALDAIITIDHEGKIIEFNPAAEELFGYASPAARGQVMAELIVPASLRERHQQGMARYLATGESRMLNQRTEITALRRDGSTFPVELTVTRIPTDGPPIFTGFLRDITPRRQAEEQLRVRVQQQAVIAELRQYALATPDLDRLMDHTVGVVARTLQLEYCKVLELLPDGHALVLRAGVGWKDGYVGRATVVTGLGSQAGYTLHTGGPVIVDNLRTETRFGGPPLLHEHGVVSGMSVVIPGHERPFGVLGAHTTTHRVFTDDDIHFLQSVANVLATAVERKVFEQRLAQEEAAVQAGRAEAERLEELDRLRRDFIATISHDLRTPLTAAKAGLGMLETSVNDRLRTDEQQLVSDVRRSIERLRLLIDDLIALNQLKAGPLQLDREPLDLRTIVADTLPTVQPLIGEKGQTLEVDLREPLLTEGDRRRLAQVVMNLLANAHWHTPPGTCIRIAGCVADGEVRLMVSDTGPGIPVEEHEAIFERLHRLSKVERGSGLGLPIARGIVEVHGGRLWVESQLGQGATFYVALPRTSQEVPL